MKKENSKIAEKLTTFLFYASVLIFLVAFNFQDSRTGGWYQQWLPGGLGNAPIKDMVFIDSLTGYIIAGSPYLLKTTNGGDNWFVNQNFGDTVNLNKIHILNRDSIILGEGFSIYKSNNGGQNFIRLKFPPVSFYAEDIFAFSYDSIWVAGGDGMHGGIYLTTNGGINWIQKFQYDDQVDKIYFYNHRIGFSCSSIQTLKTTDGGYNWFQVIAEPYTDIYFGDSLKGWKIYGNIKKTTNGGINWITQSFPVLPPYYFNNAETISKYNNDTIWGVGSLSSFGRAIIYKTTNGGINWGYQQPDTSIHISRFEFCNFINRLNGWCYAGGSGIHTKTGGNDTTFYTSINTICQIPPKNFELKQNYPNPYNNSSLIEYYINESGWVKLKIFDMAGKETATLVNEVQSTGGYGIPVSVDLSSGVYFYKMIFTTKDGIQSDTKKMVVIK